MSLITIMKIECMPSLPPPSPLKKKKQHILMTKLTRHNQIVCINIGNIQQQLEKKCEKFISAYPIAQSSSFVTHILLYKDEILKRCINVVFITRSATSNLLMDVMPLFGCILCK